MVLLSVNVDHTVMMRSDLSTFLPTLGLLGAILKKIRLRTHKKHQKTQKIYSKDLWHCTRSCPTVYLLVGAMSDDLVGLDAAYMRYQEGCSGNLKRSIRRKAEHMI